MADCTGCRYQSGELGVIGLHCNYLLITGRTRLGQMTEAQRAETRRTGACLFKERGPQATVIEAPQEMYGIPRIKPRRVRYDRAVFRKLWEQGLSDSQMAKEVGCAKETVLQWRKEEGLPFNEAHIHFDREKMLELYQQGRNDAEIGRELGCSPQTVKHWRSTQGLPILTPRRRVDWEAVRRLYMAGFGDAEISRLVGCNENTVYRWREKERLPANRFRKKGTGERQSPSRPEADSPLYTRGPLGDEAPPAQGSR